ncbi:DNA breaking-rejoining enzyme [Trametes versicolor FP-101664 SS1]|uniref:DNA breaking-rejoining enzyme n=1 Tax=Trametes versicolor (strain FP-101664) TaxID=717944 RepID=UPI0004622259|nr:DNA breaking-rejoining enzyme [Trametes versicolor FP-101664 SS1]EIW64723.1 DNA breaking-rejoining enzyme [Trametes versicolor FP-101664 SS1]
MREAGKGKARARASAHAKKRVTSSAGRTPAIAKPSPPILRVRKPRKPKTENQITTSNFRPHVLAEDRLAAWHTPFGSAFRSTASSFLPKETSSLLFSTMLQAIEPKTRKNYGAGLLRFTQFCDCIHIPKKDRMPANETLLAAFIATWAGKVARTTTDSWLAGLAFWHTLNGAPWHGDRILRTTCQAAGKLEPAKLAKRPPVTLEHMHALRAGLNLSNAFDAAVYATACCAFWGCRRLGELVIGSRNAFDAAKHVARGTTVSFKELPGGARYAIFHIPWTKTTKFAGADVVLTVNPDPTEPASALRHHLVANASVPATAPLFSFETDSGAWAPMTRDWFLDRCNEVWKAADLGEISGHCFRIGGATELLLRGTHPDIVATQGGWKSRSFLEYWRKIESILPLFISSSFDKSRLKLVEDSMTAFKRKYGPR